MSETKWSPEPWRLSADAEEWREGWLDDANGDAICSGREGEIGIADLRRIVAAVNAVAGIPTEALESGALAGALDTLHEVARYADLIVPMLARGGYPGKAEALRDRLTRAAAALRALGRLP